MIDKMNRKNGFTVPDGYFDKLKGKLSAIPARGRRLSPVPYLALAACFAVMVLAGNFILRRTAGTTVSEDLVAYADIIPPSMPLEFAYDWIAGDDGQEADVEEADIASWLIENGTSVELIDYLSNENNPY